MSREIALSLSRLCSACGMCCDGTLFDLVKIQSTDSVKTLKLHGLRIKEKRGETFFDQPCPTHEAGCCSIYQDRPQRCRLFNCQQLQRVESGEIDEVQAHEKIQETRDRIEKILSHLTALGSTNSKRSLMTRYRAVCAQPLSGLSDPEEIVRRSELDHEMQALEQILKNEFR